jgi:UDP-N-acetyl-D-glucosamine dehydrogenase
VLGVAYKKDIDDMRESPALDVIRLLEEKGAEVQFHDPHVASFREEGHERTGVPLTDAVLAKADAVVIITDHSAIDWDRVTSRASLIVDTRNALGRARPTKARVVALTPRAPSLAPSATVAKKGRPSANQGARRR